MINRMFEVNILTKISLVIKYVTILWRQFRFIIFTYDKNNKNSIFSKFKIICILFIMICVKNLLFTYKLYI